MKEKKVQGCIYVLTNLIDGKKYVGKHNNLETIEQYWDWHLQTALKGEGSYVHNAIKKHTPLDSLVAPFSAEVVWAGPLEKLNEKETYYIKKLKAFSDWGSGYNLTMGGDGVTNHSQITLDRLSQASKDWWNGERRAAKSKAMKEYYTTPEGQAQIAALLDASRTPVAIAKMSATKMLQWEDEEFHARCAAAIAASLRLPERRAAAAAASTGVYPSQATRQLMSITHKNLANTPERHAQLMYAAACHVAALEARRNEKVE